MRLLSILLTGVVISLHPSTFAHSEVVASLTFERYENTITLTAVLSKNALTTALLKEADCRPENMLRVCGNSYFQEHHTILVNGKEAEMEFASMELRKESIVYTYTFTADDAITKVLVKSSYLFEYSDHAVENVAFKFDGDAQHYQLLHNRRELTAQFK